MFVHIVEPDPTYVKHMQALLLQLGAVPTATDDRIFEVADSFDADSYHGLRAHQEMPKTLETEHKAERAWIEAYTGTFDFYVSLKTQLMTKGRLSVNQWAAISRAIERDKARAQASEAPQAFTLKPGVVLVVGQFLARRIADEAGVGKPHHAFWVGAVLRETPRAWQVRVRFSAGRTAFCCICGLKLTNQASVDAGIGPICAEKYGVGFQSGALNELAEKLPEVEVVTWIGKRSVKNWKELGLPAPTTVAA